MTHEETIKRIQSLVPSVMELEEGCVVKDFLKGELEILAVYSIRGESDVYDYVFRGEEEVSVGRSPRGNWEILGKPITLAVVLLAIGTTEYANKVGCDANGDMVKIETYEDRTRTKADWDLEKDNFNDQSEETKAFIGGLLGN